MDYDKLIERWRSLANRWENGEQLLLDGTMRIEEELRTAATAIESLRADLARVTAERDAAIERIMEWEKFDTYLLIHNFLPPEKWRGIKKED